MFWEKVAAHRTWELGERKKDGDLGGSGIRTEFYFIATLATLYFSKAKKKSRLYLYLQNLLAHLQ